VPRGAGGGETVAEARPVVRLPRSEFPINEYQVKLADTMMAHFWHLFPLGNGLPANYLRDLRVTRRLLLYYSGVFARSTHFILLTVNQIMRHKVNSSVSIRAKKCEGQFAEVQALVNDPDFLELLSAGVMDPTGEDAQEVFRKILPFCSLSGKHVMWGKP
jgi:hypothetical protein